MRREKELQGMSIDIDQIPDDLRKCKPWNPNIMHAKYKFESGPRLDSSRAFRTSQIQRCTRRGQNVCEK
jgi:hypothetical protein